MDDALLVANPAASGFTGGLHRDVAARLSTRYRVRPAWPRSSDHATALALEAVQSGVGLIVAMGGDGIVHHVAQALVGTRSALGIVPAGTTNVLARILGIPLRGKAAARVLAGDHRIEAQPVADVVGTRPGGDPMRVSATFAVGLGFDAEVVRVAEAEPYRKYRFGSVHYARTALAAVRKEPVEGPFPATMTAGGRRRRARGAMVQFRRAYTFFGSVPLRLAPADPAPMTVLLVESLRLVHTGRIVTAASTGGDLGSVPGLHVWTGCATLSVEAPAGIPVQVDGEVLGDLVEITVRHRPASLRVVRPHDGGGSPE
jgi:diacylglycerol kinase (ATP)